MFSDMICFVVQDRGKSNLWWNGLLRSFMTMILWNKWLIQALKELSPPRLSHNMQISSLSAFRYNLLACVISIKKNLISHDEQIMSICIQVLSISILS